ncbi:hypothetical protein FRC08_018104 [Ceratobasidium sp. 394]|nr:hypothetical protein FRC08_018104 [Ceratobasidium sp. 394]
MVSPPTDGPGSEAPSRSAPQLGSQPAMPPPENSKVDSGTLRSIIVRVLCAIFWSCLRLLRFLVLCGFGRQSPHRSFLGASLFSSLSLARSSFRPHTKARKGMLVMEFNTKWREWSCPVEVWYQTQCNRSLEQRSTGSTRFSVIQHRRTREPPFFHEFLIIILADGSLYRMERTGVGLNADALGGSGCTARDIIEWFSKEGYEEFIQERPSDLIAEVTFPCEFDVLDVLEICYRIQHGNKQYGRNYSLQCFNCYFFCCAVLSVLARRFADQQMTESSKDQGEELFSSALGRMVDLGQSPPEAKAKQFYVLRISSGVELDGVPLLNHIAAMLRDGSQPSPTGKGKGSVPKEHLLTQMLRIRGFLRMKQMIGNKPQFSQLVDSIWWSCLGQHDDYISQITQPLICDVAAWLDPYSPKCALPTSVDLSHQQTEMCSLVKAVVEQTSRLSSDVGWEVDWGLTWSYFKRTQVRYGSHFFGWIYRSALHVWLLKWFGVQLQRSGIGFAVIPWCIDKFVAWRRYRILSKLRSYLWENGYPELRIGLKQKDSEHAVVVNRVFDALACRGKIGLEDSAAAYLALESAGYGDCFQHSTQLLLRDIVAELLKELAVSKGAVVQLRKPTSSGTTLNDVGIFAFQEHIQQHVQTYAQRVDENNLDSSVLVCADVKKAISELIAERSVTQEVVEEMTPIPSSKDVQDEGSTDKEGSIEKELLRWEEALSLLGFPGLTCFGVPLLSACIIKELIFDIAVRGRPFREYEFHLVRRSMYIVDKVMYHIL